MDERAVVTCFLRHRGDVLLLCSSDAVGSYADLYDGAAPPRSPIRRST